ncbi:hypothetical protein OEA41_001911 [Lepraria neglecta]|uniref:Uncharacterized protein n=1 Tax=Lepraria neglecta TaxID=209136 RepID=A0AAD9ZB18_9LECA|nr:hypothetical protein OEA41_001911 [Lepraria neglecta]
MLRAAQDDSDIAAYGNDQCKKLYELDDRAAEKAQTREDIECGIPKLVQARQRVERLEQEISVPRFTLECLRDEAQRPLEAALEEAKLLVILPGLSDTVGDELINSIYIEISSTGPATRSEIVIPEGETESKETFPKQSALDKNARDIHRYGEFDPKRFTQTDFDNRQLKIGQEITRDLIEAEGAHETGKKYAEALGMDPNEPSSYFGDLFGDGNLAGSQLMALSQTVDRARVEKCLGSASDIGSQENIEPTRYR